MGEWLQVVSRAHQYELNTNCRSHQEDFYAFATLSLDPEELRLSVKKKLGIDWDPTAVDEKVARQVMFVGIYDG